MKTTLANVVRADYISKIMGFLAEQGEDVALTASNTCNLPFVIDGEEGVLEVVVKVVKKDYDECMQEREDYIMHIEEKNEKKAKAEAEKAKKIAKDKAKREAKKKTETAN